MVLVDWKERCFGEEEILSLGLGLMSLRLPVRNIDWRFERVVGVIVDIEYAFAAAGCHTKD